CLPLLSSTFTWTACGSRESGRLLLRNLAQPLATNHRAFARFVLPLYDFLHVIFRITAGLVLLLASFASAQSPRSAALVQQGQSALDNGDVERAVASFQQARQLDPGSLEANRGLALSLLQAGNPRESGQVATEALTKWPNDAQLQHWLGLAYFKTGQ